MPRLWIPEDERAFQAWYADVSSRLGLDPDPDDPRHFYDWRAAFSVGTTEDASGHWPSEFKYPGHPNQFVDGIDTITGKPVAVTPRNLENTELWQDKPRSMLGSGIGKLLGKDRSEITPLSLPNSQKSQYLTDLINAIPNEFDRKVVSFLVDMMRDPSSVMEK